MSCNLLDAKNEDVQRVQDRKRMCICESGKCKEYFLVVNPLKAGMEFHGPMCERYIQIWYTYGTDKAVKINMKDASVKSLNIIILHLS